jgi:two-component system sensor histidine kinase BaeS
MTEHPVPGEGRAPMRPPWWPEGEPFPPTGPPSWASGRGRPPWGRGRRRFMRRAGLSFVAFFFVCAVLGSVAFHLVANVFAAEGGLSVRGLSLAALIAGVVALAAGGRLFRRYTAPVGELIDGANRIEGGDLTTRVAETGPREVRSVARALNSMATQLEATDVRRRTFLADVTHELRTPLSVIRGRAEGIVDGVYPGDREHVGPILESARILERLIEDLRTLALAEAGGLTLRKETVDLAVLINETLAAFHDVAREHSVELRADLAPDLPAVQADGGRLQSVFSNLVSNALRHTPNGGGVLVTAGRGDASVVVEVEDSGAGIPAELLPRVFERFVKGVDSSGSGLGLAIARDLVVAHGGDITAAAAPGGGTLMTVRLPYPI